MDSDNTLSSKENIPDNELNKDKQKAVDKKVSKDGEPSTSKKPIKFETIPLDQEIVVIDKKYISKEHTLLRVKPSTMNKSKFTIKDINDKKLFYCIIHTTKKTQSSIMDLKGESIINFELDTKLHSKTSKLHIYTGKDNENEQKITFSSRNSTKAIKFTVEFFDKSNKQEIFDVIFDKSKIINIYYGKMKKGGSLICKADTHSLFKNSSKIEIAPGIDIIFMMAIVFSTSQLIQSTDELNFLVVM